MFFSGGLYQSSVNPNGNSSNSVNEFGKTLHQDIRDYFGGIGNFLNNLVNRTTSIPKDVSSNFALPLTALGIGAAVVGGVVLYNVVKK